MWLLLLACVPKAEVDASGEVKLSALRREGLTVMATVLARDLPAPPPAPLPAPGEIERGLDQARLGPATVLDPVRDAAFLRNDYVGNVLFGGGLIRSGETALEVRARLLEFHQQEELAIQGRQWVDGLVDAAVRLRGLEPRPAPAVTDLVIDRVPRRGLHEDDGRDNLNLPRMSLRPGLLTAAGRAAAGPDGWLLIPVLRQYYTHNAGWFVGQRWGTMAGARAEVWLLLYDVDRGTPTWWMAATGRHLAPAVGQASRAELDQFLLDAEAQVADAVHRRLFR